MKQILFALAATGCLHASAQKLGIGTNNPTRAALEVHGAVGATAAIFGGDGSGISLTRNWPSVGFNHYYNVSNRYMANGYAAMQFLDPTAGYMAFDMFVNGTGNQICNSPNRILTLTPNGNFWLGTNPHNSSLSVPRSYNVDNTAYLMGTTHHSAFNFGAGENTYIRAGKDGGKVFINDIPGGKTVMSGSVGIGTATPAYPLELRLHRNSFGGNSGIALVDPNTFDWWHLSITPSGHDFYLGCNNVSKGYFDISNGSYAHTSDGRVKTNIQALAPVLHQIIKLRPVRYEMTDNNPRHEKTIGLIAQEVKTVFPQVVSTNTGGAHGNKSLEDLHSMNYTDFHTLVIKAIQEQQQMIESQDRELAELEKEYEALYQQSRRQGLATKNP